jgi:uncharacterized YccA/Bax inhibitor family protein
MNENLWEREIREAQGLPAIDRKGSPADELPPNLFDGQPSTTRTATPPGASTLPPPPPPPVGAIPPAPDEVSPWTPAGRPPVTDYAKMRVGGVASATLLLLATCLVTGVIGWNAVEVVTQEVNGKTEVLSSSVPWWVWGSIFVGFGLAIVTIIKPKLARITGVLYAAAEGVFLGGISHLFNAQWDGIVLQAVGMTAGIFAAMLFLFVTRIIRVTEKVRMAIIGATLGVALFYLVALVISLFGGHMPLLNEPSLLGIGISLLIVGVASFNLLLDFDFVEKAVEAGAPRYMEWFGAFSLMVTLVWLYLEVLRLLALLRSR